MGTRMRAHPRAGVQLRKARSSDSIPRMLVRSKVLIFGLSIVLILLLSPGTRQARRATRLGNWPRPGLAFSLRENILGESVEYHDPTRDDEYHEGNMSKMLGY
jgi:uncharacterized protein YigA (DUF484 family)|mmetsp:Transcript_105738/g.170201  ORF Transcript_105738/g.170201 Transcript_105738/m.170201 type:complete len:103 (-) Transcript_105738:30-338(-)